MSKDKEELGSWIIAEKQNSFLSCIRPDLTSILCVIPVEFPNVGRVSEDGKIYAQVKDYEGNVYERSLEEIYTSKSAAYTVLERMTEA